jgi:glycine hydroxymethyltransferase
MREIANLMCDVMDNIEDDNMISLVREKVALLCARFPVYEA